MVVGAKHILWSINDQFFNQSNVEKRGVLNIYIYVLDKHKFFPNHYSVLGIKIPSKH